MSSEGATPVEAVRPHPSRSSGPLTPHEVLSASQLGLEGVLEQHPVALLRAVGRQVARHGLTSYLTTLLAAPGDEATAALLIVRSMARSETDLARAQRALARRPLHRLPAWLLDIEVSEADDLAAEPVERTELQRHWWQLEALVGGRGALLALTDDPLPDEEPTLGGLSTAAAEEVRAVCARADGWIATTFGTEFRTACRRLQVRLAHACPALARSPLGHGEKAAAVVWLVGRANALGAPELDRRRPLPPEVEVVTCDGAATVDELVRGLGSATVDAGLRLAGALEGRGGNPWTFVPGPTLLTSARRREMCRSRDWLLARGC